MFRGHTSEWKSVSRRRARNSACNLTVFEGEYHCKYMNNNAFAQAWCSFFQSLRPTKTRRCELASACPPQSSTRIRSGGGRRWSTCVKRWNVATLSPRRRGDTARPIQGDRRKPRERRRNPRSRRVGDAGKPSVLHPDPQRGRKAVEHVHQAVERRHALPQTKGRHRAADPRRPEEAP